MLKVNYQFTRYSQNKLCSCLSTYFTQTVPVSIWVLFKVSVMGQRGGNKARSSNRTLGNLQEGIQEKGEERGLNTERPLCIRHHVRRCTFTVPFLFSFSFSHIFYLPLLSWDNQSVTFLPFRLFSFVPQD